MKSGILLILIAVLILSCDKKVQKVENFDDSIYQFGSKQAFLEKKYVGNNSYKKIKSLGDFGLGTFNYVDGEMAAVNGNFMRIPVSGVNNSASDTLKAPFAVVKFFRSDQTESIDDSLTLTDLKSMITLMLSDTTKPVAVKITGSFNSVSARSVHRQKVPFQSLQEIVENQIVFEFNDTEGFLVGYWFPRFMDGVNFPGYHFHFLTKNLKQGGHLLDCKIKNVKIELDYTSRLVVN